MPPIDSILTNLLYEGDKFLDYFISRRYLLLGVILVFYGLKRLTT